MATFLPSEAGRTTTRTDTIELYRHSRGAASLNAYSYRTASTTDPLFDRVRVRRVSVRFLAVVRDAAAFVERPLELVLVSRAAAAPSRMP